MTKHRLEIEYEYDFFLAGISCHEKPYRLCWAINKALELDMKLVDPLSLSLKKNEIPSDFPLFMHKNVEQETILYLIGNKHEDGLLIPEHHQADYFFIAKGPYNESDFVNMIASIREISFVLMSYRIDPEMLKSKQNLLF